MLNNTPLSGGNAICPPTYWWASWLLTVRAVRTTAAVHTCAQAFVWACVFSSFGGTRKSVIAGFEIGYWPGDLPLSPQGPFWQWPPFCDNPTRLLCQGLPVLHCKHFPNQSGHKGLDCALRKEYLKCVRASSPQSWLVCVHPSTKAPFQTSYFGLSGHLQENLI